MTASIVTEFPFIPAGAHSIRIRKPVYGIGINDADYVVNISINGGRRTCHYYGVWTDMLRRCYCTKYYAKRPTYRTCTVSEGWLLFSTFRAWMDKQDWRGKQLDKDILNPGNKYYAPENCLFVSCAINNLLTDSGAARGIYPMGVSLRKSNGTFNATVNQFGKAVRLGNFTTPKKASEAYREAKSTYIKEVADGEGEPLRSALIRHANLVNPVSVPPLPVEKIAA